MKTRIRGCKFAENLLEWLTDQQFGSPPAFVVRRGVTAQARAVSVWTTRIESDHGDRDVLALRTYGHVQPDDLKGVVGMFSRPEPNDAAS